jgi:hypothetical protein
MIVPLAIGAASLFGLTLFGKKQEPNGHAPVSPRVPPERIPAIMAALSAAVEGGVTLEQVQAAIEEAAREGLVSTFAALEGKRKVLEAERDKAPPAEEPEPDKDAEELLSDASTAQGPPLVDADPIEAAIPTQPGEAEDAEIAEVAPEPKAARSRKTRRS